MFRLRQETLTVERSVTSCMKSRPVTLRRCLALTLRGLAS